MKSRIDKLLRQRDLLREHLKWIEEEIAATPSGALPAFSESKAEIAEIAPPGPPSIPDSPPSPAVADLANEALLPEPDIENVHNEVRAGCLLYFSIASAAFGLLVAYIYWRY